MKYKLTIGCDPELAVADQHGSMVSADTKFHGEGTFGCDGASTTAELRPGYSDDPREVVANIQELMEREKEAYPHQGLYAGHYKFGLPIGGHIHIGHNRQSVDLVRIGSSLLVENLELLVGGFEALVHNRDEMEQRRRRGYGMPRSWRWQDHGLEYRAPGSWLLSPAVAACTLTLAKLATVAWMDEIDLNTLKHKSESKRTLLLNLAKRLKNIPKDCLDGLQWTELILRMPKPDWNIDIVPNWTEVAEGEA